MYPNSLSLSYTANKYGGAIFITVSIDHKNINIAEKEIIKYLKSLRKERFSKDDYVGESQFYAIDYLENAKNQIKFRAHESQEKGLSVAVSLARYLLIKESSEDEDDNYLENIEKLAYNVSSRLSLYKEGGLFEVYLETDKKKMDAAREALQRTLDNLIEEGVSEKAHRANLTYFKGSFLRQIETKRNRTYSLLVCEALGLGYSFLDRIFPEVDKTTLDEMNDFIKDILSPDRKIEIIIGKK